jgi:hypothetical protein
LPDSTKGKLPVVVVWVMDISSARVANGIKNIPGIIS